MKSFLDDIPPINWANLEEAHDQTRKVLESLAADKKLLRELVLRVEHDEHLFSKCEVHSLDDKIVLHDELSRGFRLRLRLATSTQYERAHQHRFPFTTLILYGKYYQRWYQTDRPFDETITASQIHPVCIREEGPGACFTIDHKAIHSTMTEPDTISLLLRGPTMQDKALIVHKETGKLWYRVGEQDESPERRKEKQMSKEKYREWVRKMESFGLI